MSYQPPYQQQYQTQSSAPPFAAFPGQAHAYASPQMIVERPHSKFGIASFVTGLIVGLAELALLIIAGVMETSTPGGISEDDPKAMVLGLFLLLGLLLAFIGATIGVAGLFEANKKKVFCVLGVIFNGLSLAAVVAIIGIGMAG